MCSCPVCGQTNYKEGKLCGKIGQSVCIDCCATCEHYFKNEVYISHGCRYGLKEQEQRKSKIIYLKLRIKELDNQQANLYRRGYQRKAEAMAWEALELKRNLKALEEEHA